MADDVGSLLLRAGLVQPDQLSSARKTAKSEGGTVPEHLVRNKFVKDEDLTSFYRTRLLIPRINPSELSRLSAKLLEKVPADMASEFRSIPVALDPDGNLTLVMSDPTDTKAAEEISFFTGTYVMRAVATQAQIAWCLAHYYQQETDLYNDLVAEGVWPKTDPKSDEPAKVKFDSDGETAPMKVQPRPIKVKRAKRAREDDSKEKKDTGPMKVRPKRNPNQQPSPPELAARAGEIESRTQRDHMVETMPGVQINLDIQEEAVVREIQRGTDTSPILLSSIKSKLDEASQQSGPIILDEAARKKRVSKQTHLGLGAISAGSADPSPIQKALAEHAESGPTDVSAARPDASQLADVPTRGKARADSEGEPTVPDALAGKIKAPPALKDQHARSLDLVGGNWGEPGTTIPPKYLGATPEDLDDVGDSVPTPIDDEPVTKEINIGDQSIPVEVDPDADETIRSVAPSAAKQGNLAESASKLLGALRSIDRAEDKGAILEPILTFLDNAYERTGFLALRNEELVTWRLHGCMDDAKSSLNADKNGMFKDAIRARLPYNGPINDDETKRLARDLDIPDAMDVLAIPIAIRGRVIGLLFGLGSYDAVFEEHLTVLTQAAGEAFERLLLARK